MPIYEYECRGCGARHEFIQKFSDRPKRKCPACGKLRLRKLISAAAFHLKGDGWYVTDFRDKGKGKAKEKTDSTESSGDSKPGPNSSDSKSTDSKSSDSKSADKKSGAGSKASGGSVGSSQAA
ncbi:MAG: zinc ribbon domain-containing protein [Thiotrichales bacterium]|nr:zinc ribbon domain-containing protein [Thiotrichales bacterium]MCY4283912.1 zinc ribbon domain-containing protein [Thiotrichales bacterium]MCY4350161.1 zinc ribbon domain-containing protein [Thiotrichales bacterium]